MVKILDRETLDLFPEEKDLRASTEKNSEINLTVVGDIIRKEIELFGKDSVMGFGKFFNQYQERTGVALDANNIYNLSAISEKIKEIAGNNTMAKEFDSHIKSMRRKDDDQRLHEEEQGMTKEKPIAQWISRIEKMQPPEDE
jgi:hypothetical protein